jgi:hypothetical protein
MFSRARGNNSCQITYYRIAFWCIAVFTASSFFVCIGVGPYKCIAENFADMSYCASEEALRYQDISLKIYFALDVSTDALSKTPYPYIFRVC